VLTDSFQDVGLRPLQRPERKDGGNPALPGQIDVILLDLMMPDERDGGSGPNPGNRSQSARYCYYRLCHGRISRRSHEKGAYDFIPNLLRLISSAS